MMKHAISSWDKNTDVMTLIYHLFILDIKSIEAHNDGQHKCLWRDCVLEDNNFTSHVDLMTHVYAHAYHQKLKCIGATLLGKNKLIKCTLDSSNRNALPDPIEPMICQWKECKKTILNPEEYYMHVNSHVDIYPGGNSIKDGCNCHWKSCSTNVKSKYRLREHVRTHTHEKFCACPSCGGFYSNATKFIDHINRQANSPTLSYHCSHCDKRFSTKRLLRNHMGHHVYKYRCPFCNMTCLNPSALRTHIRYKHMEERAHICPLCQWRSKSAVDLRRHCEVHKEEFLFCESKGCTFKTRFLWDLNLHIRNQHQSDEKAKYLCHVCEKKYYSGATLTLHFKKKHTLDLPDGHSRFRYKLHRDGYYRLQTIRYESIKMMEQDIQLDFQSNEDENESHVEGYSQPAQISLLSKPLQDPDSIGLIETPSCEGTVSGANREEEIIDEKNIIFCQTLNNNNKHLNDHFMITQL